jgi:ribose transport system substrate-binding protein
VARPGPVDQTRLIYSTAHAALPTPVVLEKTVTVNSKPILIAMSLLLAAACGSAQKPPAPAKGVAAKNALHTPLSCDRPLDQDRLVTYKAPKAKKRYKVTLLEVSLAGYYYQALAYGADKAAKDAGVDLSIVASQGFASAPQQLTQVHDVLTRGTDSIVLQPADVNGSVAALDAAAKADVPVVVVGSLVNDQKVPQIQQDDYLQGKQAAQTLASKLPKGGEGIVMGGPSNATWALRRVAGFQDELKNHPGLKINATVNSLVDPGEGLSKFTNATAAHPKVDWIYPVYSLLLPPAAVPAQHRKAVYLAGSFEPDTRDALQAGKASAIIPDWPIHMGYVGVSHAVAQLNGETLPKMTCFPNVTLTAADIHSPVAEAQLYPAGFKAGD